MGSKHSNVQSLVYNELYKNGYPHGGLGFPLTWAGVFPKELNCLDIGCGHGILCKRFKKYVGVDISDYVIEENKKKYPGIEFYAKDAKDIKDERIFDVVLAIDTLEHFPEKEIEWYLEAISKITTEYYLFSICCRKSGYKASDGGELHTCLLNQGQWLELLANYFIIRRCSEMNRQQTFCVKAV